jgi:hypothetical protein
MVALGVARESDAVTADRVNGCGDRSSVPANFTVLASYMDSAESAH